MQKARQEEAAAIAKRIWQKAEPASGDNSYLTGKGINGHERAEGLRGLVSRLASQDRRKIFGCRPVQTAGSEVNAGVLWGVSTKAILRCYWRNQLLRQILRR